MTTFPCGHPRTDENSYFQPRRRCKTCHRENTAAYRRQNREYYRLWNRLYYYRLTNKCLLAQLWKPSAGRTTKIG